MRPFTTRLLTLLSFIVASLAVNAQTYNIPASVSTSSFGSLSSCSGCTINLSPGVVLTVNSNVSCSNCTFNGGTINFTSGSVTMNGTNAFDNDTVLINEALNVNSMNFSGDSVAINSTLIIGSGGTTMSITGGSITSAGKISTGSSVTLAGDTVTMTGGYLAASSITVKANGTTGSILTMSGSAHDSTGGNLTMTNTALAMSNSSYMKSSSSTFTSSTVTMSNTAILEPTNGLTFTSSTLQMNDTTAVTAGSLTVQTGSYVTIGNNGTSTASITIQNGLKVLDTSTLAISGHNNYVTSGNNSFTGGSTSYPINNNTVSCGGAGENACKPDFVFGCATMNAGGAVGCTVLAVADIELSASPAGDNEVNVSWSDLQYASADHYLVQRGAAGGDWKTLATIDGNGYAAGSYHFEDAAAPAGADNYRIARVDQSGATVYSSISSVTLVPAVAAIRIYPNPAAGHTFNISAPSTDQFILNIYTLTGQLIMHTTLWGQNQYPVLLPLQLAPGTTVVVQTILADRSSSFPLLLR